MAGGVPAPVVASRTTSVRCAPAGITVPAAAAALARAINGAMVADVLSVRAIIARTVRAQVRAQVRAKARGRARVRADDDAAAAEKRSANG